MFDTYAAAKALRNAGFDEPRAEAAVAMVRPDGMPSVFAAPKTAKENVKKLDASHK